MLKIYIQDRGWSGATFVIASSLEKAMEIASKEYGFEYSRGFQEPVEVTDGFAYDNLGDQ